MCRLEDILSLSNKLKGPASVEGTTGKANEEDGNGCKGGDAGGTCKEGS